MQAIEYRCPDCGLMAKNMILKFVTDKCLTQDEETRLVEEPALGTGIMYSCTCPVSGKTYSVFELERYEFEGTVEEYKARYSGVFPK